ncbi:DUF4190 domain-containing protein [Streptomyces phaeoluteigriseus]|uniref:DUF4190 domain-containing protein n=1 Tax=Streptomyces phaeoluteigriseus TaxID=114686 RepID=UPI0036A11FDD
MSDDAPTDSADHPWAAPGSVPEGTEGPQYASVPLEKGDASGGPAARDARASDAAAPSADAWPAPAPTPEHGSGVTIASGEVPTPQDHAQPSVHDQRTVTSLPGVTPTPTVGTPRADAPFASFPPPHPATASGPTPFAPPADGAVPPPPISPDGPGQVPYGYPGGYGFPGGPGYGGTPGHGGTLGYGGVPGHYGWAAPQPGPSNGMGMAAMVLGIVAAVGFCLWPVAIVTGVLALIFGLIGRSKANRGEASNPGQALAGIICGTVGILLGTGLAVLIMVAP